MKLKRILLYAFVCLFTFLGFMLPSTSAMVPAEQMLNDNDKTVHIISLKGEITKAMSSYLSRSIHRATLSGADGIIIDISTLGGRVVDALEMSEAIINSEMPVVVFVGDRAISAGAMITISADTIIMAQGSQMGAAEPIPFSEKSVAFVSGEFKSLAELRGRDTQIAIAMVDKGVTIPGLVREGSILFMTAQDAFEVGYADAILGSTSEALVFMGWENARVVQIAPDYKVTIAQFFTRSDVASLLLTIGMIAVIIEILTQGFGVAGIIGISAFAFYFGGGILAGNTEWWSVMLFAVGIILLLVEMAIPGFGAFGFGGIACMVVSIIFAAPYPERGFIYLGVAIIMTAIATPILFKFLGSIKSFDRLVLSHVETVENGYVNLQGNDYLLGMTAEAITPLRPSGIIKVEGQRMDAVSDGSFLPAGTQVKIIQVEGSRIVVAKNMG